MTGIGGSDESAGIFTVNKMTALNRKANSHGIDTAASVREGLIEMRGAMLVSNDFQGAVLLTHAIWWLSTIQEVMEADAVNGL